MLLKGQPSGAVDAGDGQFELMLGVPADAFGEGQEVAGEQLFEVLDAFQFRFQGVESRVVVLIEGQPILEVVVEMLLPALHLEVAQVDVLDLEQLGGLADAQL